MSLKLKFIRQEELKTITYHYNSQEAAQRTYAPQGFVGLLTAGLDKSKHFVEVDLDDPFFRQFAVTVDAPIDFGKIGLTAAHVALDYGDQSEPATLKHKELRFTPEDHAEKSFEVFMNRKMDLDYTQHVQFHFDPQSGWEGERFSYDLEATKTQDRTLLLNPFEHLGFLEITVFPSRIDAGMVDFTDVHLRYEGGTGWTKETVVVVTPTSAPQKWLLRLTDPRARTYSYRFVHHMKDGSRQESETYRTSRPAVPVVDGFKAALDLEFLPQFDAAAVKFVLIDVLYEDLPHAYRREEQLRLDGASTDSARLRIALLDPAKRDFQYRFTFVSPSNQIRRGAFQEGTDTLISIAEP